MDQKEPIIIKTKCFTLRQLRMSDAQAIAKYINDKTIAHNLLSLPYPYTIDDAHDWLRRVYNVARRKNRTEINLGIEIDGEIVGGVGIFKIHDHKAEIGYWLARQYWGRGIMTKAVKEITKFGFGQLGLRRLYAHVFPYNKGSMRVLEKAGYKFEGVLKKNVKKHSKLIDEYLWAKVR
jgi:ribosomal-protein-alanine N-acetyltransferase